MWFSGRECMACSRHWVPTVQKKKEKEKKFKKCYNANHFTEEGWKNLTSPPEVLCLFAAFPS
jgi:hypothetical protein